MNEEYLLFSISNYELTITMHDKLVSFWMKYTT